LNYFHHREIKPSKFVRICCLNVTINGSLASADTSTLGVIGLRSHKLGPWGIGGGTGSSNVALAKLGCYSILTW
jgi:hypothetical protein